MATNKTYTNMGIISGLTTYNPKTHPVNNDAVEVGAVAIPPRRSAQVSQTTFKINPAELAAVLAWSAQIKADLS